MSDTILVTGMAPVRGGADWRGPTFRWAGAQSDALPGKTLIERPSA